MQRIFKYGDIPDKELNIVIYWTPSCVIIYRSLEVRRQKALDRIKSRAERAGNTVSIAGDVLFVNNEPVFSLSRGNIVSNNE